MILRFQHFVHFLLGFTSDSAGKNYSMMISEQSIIPKKVGSATCLVNLSVGAGKMLASASLHFAVETQILVKTRCYCHMCRRLLGPQCYLACTGRWKTTLSLSKTGIIKISTHSGFNLVYHFQCSYLFRCLGSFWSVIKVFRCKVGGSTSRDWWRDVAAVCFLKERHTLAL